MILRVLFLWISLHRDKIPLGLALWVSHIYWNCVNNGSERLCDSNLVLIVYKLEACFYNLNVLSHNRIAFLLYLVIYLMANSINHLSLIICCTVTVEHNTLHENCKHYVKLLLISSVSLPKSLNSIAVFCTNFSFVAVSKDKKLHCARGYFPYFSSV